MSAIGRMAEVGAHHLVVYDKALHPELFPVRSRRGLRVGTVEVEAWLMHGSHMVRATRLTGCVSELLSDAPGGVPMSGVISAAACAGEREFEHTCKASGMRYVCSMQCETLPSGLMRSTLRELEELAGETGAMTAAWTGGDGRACLSVLETARYGQEFHAHAYHVLTWQGVVIRTQTMVRPGA
ncbi:MAG: hypothetical protein C0475_09030 [Planctomyces sp.]|nr:hypothetical protein [Planctomyces sp.]MBA4120350.1 hypothetical protein [Isosphaera sp.]